MKKDPKNNKFKKNVNLAENKMIDISSQFSQNKPHPTQNNKSATKTSKKSVKNNDNVSFFKHMWIAMIILVATTSSIYSVSAFNDMFAVNREEKEVIVEIPQKASSAEISKILFESGIIKNQKFFNLYISLPGSYKHFKAGAFEMRIGMDYQAIKSCLTSNEHRLDSDIVTVTIPEGKNILEISAILEKNEVCSAEEFLTACKTDDFSDKYDFLKDIDNIQEREYKVEGFLFPDTYKFYKYSDVHSVIKKFLTNGSKKFRKKTAVNGYPNKVNILQRASDAKISMDKLLNIASLIQAEAANEADMYNISSVIYNRLKSQNHSEISHDENSSTCYLELDSTVWYPYRSKDKVPSDIVESFESPYNTYKHPGIPIGPICNPGIAAINAALKPNQTQYYYFCHSKDGKSYFAKTNAEHLVNLKKAGLT